MTTPPPYPDISDCAASAARLNDIADRTAAHYPSLAAALRRIADGLCESTSAAGEPGPGSGARRRAKTPAPR